MIVAPISFTRRVKSLQNGCWEWQGSKDKRGYGMYYKGNYL